MLCRENVVKVKSESEKNDTLFIGEVTKGKMVMLFQMKTKRLHIG